MTREQLESRLKELIDAKERMMADINAILGAIEECQYWLNKINAPNEPEIVDDSI